MTARRQIVIDSDAPPWAQRLQADLNSIFGGLGSDLKKVQDALEGSIGDLVIPAAATQAEQEAGTSTGAYVAPGRQVFHASAVKAWCRFNGTGTPAMTKSYNFSPTIIDNGVGDYTLTFANVAFSGGDDFAVFATSQAAATGGKRSFDPNVAGTSGTTVRVQTFDDAGAAQDHARIEVFILGDAA